MCCAPQPKAGASRLNLCMNKEAPSKNLVHLLAAAGLLFSFFLPWVSWDGIKLAGTGLPSGRFFTVASSSYGLDNPYPGFSFTFNLFWLIPVFTLLATLLYLKKKQQPLPAWIASALSLSLVTVYISFSHTLLDLGAGSSLAGLLQPGLYIQALSAFVFALTARQGALLKKAFWILVGPVFAFGTYSYIKNQLENSTFSNTASSKAEYTVNAIDLIREFAGNDSAANKKYTDKILLVKGRVAELEPADSSLNVKFIDSLSGSYAIFDFQAGDVAGAKKLSVGDSVTVKASCSGGIFSRLRKATVITFKRSALIPY